MLYHFFTSFSEYGGIFNVMNYSTFRTGGALMTALLLFFIFGGPAIDWLRSKQGKGQPIRDDGPESHILEKTGTPTMGGVLILGAIAISTLLWGRLDNGFLWVILLVTLGFGAIGFWDDYLKVSKLNTKGAPGSLRLLFGLIIAFCAAFALTMLSPEPLQEKLATPFFKDVLLNLSWFFYPFAALVILGSANAVNFTDGLDGLAIVPAMIACFSLGLIAYMVGHAVFANYLNIHAMPGSGELIVYMGALFGAGLGFLWYNAPPARVFMGDTGSLGMGAGLGTMAVAVKHELVWMVIGGLFVVETLSVIIQVAYFRLSGGKRIFLMAPIHHHFEKLGWKEPTIVIRFWIISVILALIGLSTLKLR